MAATRENVLAAIVQYVENNKRRAPAKDIADAVSDTLPNVQAIIKTLVTEGAINSSRGRNGGALPDGITLEKKGKVAKVKADIAEAPIATDNEVTGESSPSDDTAEQFALLMAQIERDSEAVPAQ